MTDFVYKLANYNQTDAPPVRSTPFYVSQDTIACLVTLQPGAMVAEHSHEHHTEIFDVVQGEGTFLLNGQEFTLTPGVTVCVPANTRHGLRAGATPWVLRETIHRHVYARQALKRALQKRWQKLKQQLFRQ